MAGPIDRQISSYIGNRLGIEEDRFDNFISPLLGGDAFWTTFVSAAWNGVETNFWEYGKDKVVGIFAGHSKGVKAVSFDKDRAIKIFTSKVADALDKNPRAVISAFQNAIFDENGKIAPKVENSPLLGPVVNGLINLVPSEIRGALPVPELSKLIFNSLYKISETEKGRGLLVNLVRNTDSNIKNNFFKLVAEPRKSGENLITMFSRTAVSEFLSNPDSKKYFAKFCNEVFERDQDGRMRLKDGVNPMIAKLITDIQDKIPTEVSSVIDKEALTGLSIQLFQNTLNDDTRRMALRDYLGDSNEKNLQRLTQGIKASLAETLNSNPAIVGDVLVKSPFVEKLNLKDAEKTAFSNAVLGILNRREVVDAVAKAVKSEDGKISFDTNGCLNAVSGVVLSDLRNGKTTEDAREILNTVLVKTNPLGVSEELNGQIATALVKPEVASFVAAILPENWAAPNFSAVIKGNFLNALKDPTRQQELATVFGSELRVSLASHLFKTQAGLGDSADKIAPILVGDNERFKTLLNAVGNSVGEDGKIQPQELLSELTGTLKAEDIKLIYGAVFDENGEVHEDVKNSPLFGSVITKIEETIPEGILGTIDKKDLATLSVGVLQTVLQDDNSKKALQVYVKNPKNPENIEKLKVCLKGALPDALAKENGVLTRILMKSPLLEKLNLPDDKKEAFVSNLVHALTDTKNSENVKEVVASLVDSTISFDGKFAFNAEKFLPTVKKVMPALLKENHALLGETLVNMPPFSNLSLSDNEKKLVANNLGRLLVENDAVCQAVTNTLEIKEGRISFNPEKCSVPFIKEALLDGLQNRSGNEAAAKILTVFLEKKNPMNLAPALNKELAQALTSPEAVPLLRSILPEGRLSLTQDDFVNFLKTDTGRGQVASVIKGDLRKKLISATLSKKINAKYTDKLADFFSTDERFKKLLGIVGKNGFQNSGQLFSEDFPNAFNSDEDRRDLAVALTPMVRDVLGIKGDANKTEPFAIVLAHFITSKDEKEFKTRKIVGSNKDEYENISEYLAKSEMQEAFGRLKASDGLKEILKSIHTGEWEDFVKGMFPDNNTFKRFREKLVTDPINASGVLPKAPVEIFKDAYSPLEHPMTALSVVFNWGIPDEWKKPPEVNFACVRPESKKTSKVVLPGEDTQSVSQNQEEISNGNSNTNLRAVLTENSEGKSDEPSSLQKRLAVQSEVKQDENGSRQGRHPDASVAVVTTYLAGKNKG